MAEYIVEDSSPSVWREEVVRCRYCKHNGTVRFVDVGFHETRVIDCEVVDPNGFCSWGKPMGGD